MTSSRPIRVLRVSVTDRCDRRCVYCMPPEGVALYSHDEILRLEEIVDAVRLLKERFGLRRVRLTGGEPLLRRGVVDLVRMLSELGLDQVLLTTNGLRLAELAGPLRDAGLSRVNVSLDSLDPATYRRITRGAELRPVLEGIDAARAAGLTPLKLNTVVLRGENDRELCGLVRFAMEKGVVVRFLELINLGEAARIHAERFVPLHEVLATLREEFEVESTERVGSSPSMRVMLRERGSGARVEIGVIASETRPFCSLCDRLRLTARGELRGCLMSDAGVDLRGWLRSAERRGEEFDDLVRRAFAAKPARRAASASHLMCKVGG